MSGYTVVDTNVFDEPNAGVEYRYARPDGFRGDVYLYPLPPQGYLCVQKCAEQAAEAVVKGFENTIPVLVQRGYVDSMIPLREASVAAPARSWLARGRRLTLRVVQEQQAFDSYLYTFVGRETILKFRVSFPLGAYPAATVDSFVRLVTAAVPPPYSCARIPPRSPSITLETTDAHSPGHIVTLLDSLLTDTLYTLDYRAPEEGRWRTVPRFLPVAPAEDSSPSPGVVLFAMVFPSHDSTTIRVTTQNACEPVKPRKSQGTGEVAGMILGLELMGSLDSALKTLP